MLAILKEVLIERTRSMGMGTTEIDTRKRPEIEQIAFAELILSKKGPSHILYCFVDGTMRRSEWSDSEAAIEEWHRLGNALRYTHSIVGTTLIRPDLVFFCGPAIMPEGHTALVLEFAVGHSRSDHRALHYEPLEVPETSAFASALVYELAKLMDERATAPVKYNFIQ